MKNNNNVHSHWGPVSGSKQRLRLTFFYPSIDTARVINYMIIFYDYEKYIETDRDDGNSVACITL